MRDRDCPQCGTPILRTHHCRAVLHPDPPTAPPPHAVLMQWAEQARLEQLAGETELHVAPTLPLLELDVVAPPSFVPNTHPSNRGGRA